MDFLFFFNSVLFGVGLAMDAFSVSIANGLREPAMRARRMAAIAGVYAVFQILMPLIGWFCVHTAAERFEKFSGFIPWIALLLLLYIGGQMIFESVKKKEATQAVAAVGFGALLLQGVATSIDALSVGFTIAELSFPAALTEALIIGAVTFLLCTVALRVGKRFGEKLAHRAGIVGGCILIGIGIEIFVKGVFF